MDSVIRETLRMHPPLHSIMRGVREDVVVPPTLAAPSEDGRYVIPKGHMAMSSASFSQMDPMLWPNATEWEPSRWSDPDGLAAQAYKAYNDVDGAKIDFGFGLVSKGTDSPYQPFGAGRHRCIGEQVSPRLVPLTQCAMEVLNSTIYSSRMCNSVPFWQPSSAKWSSSYLTEACLRQTTMYVFCLPNSLLSG